MNTKIKKIACIQLSGVFPDFCRRLVMPDYGMPLIGTILAEAGYDVAVYMEHVAPPDWDRIAQSDLVCMSTLSAGFDKTAALAGKIRRELKIPVILGGTHASYFPEACLKICDYVVIGEGDETIVELCAALENGRDLSTIAGIAYLRDGDVVRTPERPRVKNFETIPDYKLIHGYHRLSTAERLLHLRFPLATVQATRGCPYSCRYCVVDKMFPGNFATRSVESVIADLWDKRQYGKELLFVDNNFAADRRYAKALLKRMIEEDFQFDIMVLARIDVAGDDELLRLMRAAGVTQLYQGYESIRPETLIAYDKKQTVEKISAAISKLHDYGFRLSGSFVLGADTDDIDTIRSTVEFVLEHELTIAYFFPLWGHYRERKNSDSSLVPRRRSLFKGWAYCDGNFVTHFPLLMRPSVLQSEIIRAHQTVFSLKNVLGQLARRRYVHAWEKLAHRWMWSVIRKAHDDYIPWLRGLEDGLYDDRDRLIEARLTDRTRDPSWPLFPADADWDGREPQTVSERAMTCMAMPGGS